MVSPAAGWRLVSAACLVWPSLAQPAACSTHCSHCRPGLLQFLDIESHKSGIRRSRHRHPGPLPPHEKGFYSESKTLIKDATTNSVYVLNLKIGSY